MMKYIAVQWLHNNSYYPIYLYSELDENRDELRKIEVYKDGSFGFASKDGNFGGTELGLEPLPELSEIAEDQQFVFFEISSDEFDKLWLRYKHHLSE